MIEKTKKSLKKALDKKNLHVFSLIITIILMLTSLYGVFASYSLSNQDISIPQKISYQHQGKVDYTVHLHPNSLYASDELGPQSVFFTPLVDTIIIDYQYSFIAQDIRAPLSFIYEVDGLYGIEGLWQKELHLLPPTQTDSQNIAFSFALPLSDLLEYFDIFARETGSTLNEPTLDLTFKITPDFKMEKGERPEAFVQKYIIHINTKTIRPEEELTQENSKSLSISNMSVTGVEDNTKVMQRLSITGVIIALLALIYLGRGELKQILTKLQTFNSRTKDEKDFRFAKKRLGGLFVETDKITPIREEEEVIYLKSLKDLVNLADETLRPVLYQMDEDGNINFVILRLGYCSASGENGIFGIKNKTLS
ncbi:hypothetical protein HON58_03480 [Candidatus Peregrinibacteria bacterium]|jgi:hypothetical protein|nr:hypothetical protein [Candidatus Peregrinibacteria bacterium]